MSIVDILREKKLKSLKSSIQFQETLERHTHGLAADVKDMLSGNTGDALAPTESNLRTIYSRLLNEYYGGTKFVTYAVMNKRSVALWHRVSVRCEESGLSPEAFLKAQFVWFDKSFGRPPNVVQLTTEAAVLRAKEVALPTGKVVTSAVPAKLDLASILRRAEQQMQELMRVHSMSREEVYGTFIVTGLFSLPQEFLNADPVYKKVVNDRK